VAALNPPVEDGFGCRRPAQMLAELFRPGELDDDAAEIE
jgi:hypothetical protein